MRSKRRGFAGHLRTQPLDIKHTQLFALTHEANIPLLLALKCKSRAPQGTAGQFRVLHEPAPTRSQGSRKLLPPALSSPSCAIQHTWSSLPEMKCPGWNAARPEAKNLSPGAEFLDRNIDSRETPLPSFAAAVADFVRLLQIWFLVQFC